MYMDYKCLEKCLLEGIAKCQAVYIVGHNQVDIDSMAASFGLHELVTSLGKKAYIVMDDNISTIGYGANKLINDINNSVSIITSDQIKDDISSCLLIVNDVHQINRICLNNQLYDFNKCIIIDHHKLAFNAVKSNNLFIDEKTSSTCEMVATILNDLNINLGDERVYTYLYAGIVLDTDNFRRNVFSHTFAVAKYLVDNHANLNIANNLFKLNYNNEMRALNIVRQAKFPTIDTCIAMNFDNPGFIYDSIDIPKAADYLMLYDLEMAIVLGFINNNHVKISARSKGNVNVKTIMEHFGGGGNLNSASSTVKTDDIIKLYNLLTNEITMSNPISYKYTL